MCVYVYICICVCVYVSLTVIKIVKKRLVLATQNSVRFITFDNSAHYQDDPLPDSDHIDHPFKIIFCSITLRSEKLIVK